MHAHCPGENREAHSAIARKYFRDSDIMTAAGHNVPYDAPMSTERQNAFFHRLVTALLGQLKRIAHGTHGEQSVDDLQTEAWLAAQDIQDEAGREFEPEDEGFQLEILSRLQKAFGKFANRNLRFAVRLDQERISDDGEVRQNSVAAALAAPAAYQPETALEQEEDERERCRRLTERFAEAVAYCRALDHFDGDCDVLASHLALTASALRLRFARAEFALEQQPSLFDGVEAVPADFVPCAGRLLRSDSRRWPWRNACALVRPMQLRIFHSLPALLGRRC